MPTYSRKIIKLITIINRKFTTARICNQLKKNTNIKGLLTVYTYVTYKYLITGAYTL